MDNQLKEMINIAAMRGNKYVKGECSAEELPAKVAELGGFLLEKAARLQNLKVENMKEDLIEVQNKVDDLRKAIFANKIILR